VGGVVFLFGMGRGVPIFLKQIEPSAVINFVFVTLFVLQCLTPLTYAQTHATHTHTTHTRTPTHHSPPSQTAYLASSEEPWNTAYHFLCACALQWPSLVNNIAYVHSLKGMASVLERETEFTWEGERVCVCEWCVCVLRVFVRM